MQMDGYLKITTQDANLPSKCRARFISLSDAYKLDESLIVREVNLALHLEGKIASLVAACERRGFVGL